MRLNFLTPYYHVLLFNNFLTTKNFEIFFKYCTEFVFLKRWFVETSKLVVLELLEEKTDTGQHERN